jgi:hypothetical protein
VVFFTLPSVREFFFGFLNTLFLFDDMVASAESPSTILHKAGEGLMFFICGLVVQTFFFGAWSFLLCSTQFPDLEIGF